MSGQAPALRRFLFPVEADLSISAAQTGARDLLAFATAHAGLRLEAEPHWDIIASPLPGEGLAVATALCSALPGDDTDLPEQVLTERRAARRAWAKTRQVGREQLLAAAFDRGQTAAETARWYGVSVWDVWRYGWPSTLEADRVRTGS